MYFPIVYLREENQRTFKQIGKTLSLKDMFEVNLNGVTYSLGNYKNNFYHGKEIPIGFNFQEENRVLCCFLNEINLSSNNNSLFTSSGFINKNLDLILSSEIDLTERELLIKPFKVRNKSIPNWFYIEEN